MEIRKGTFVFTEQQEDMARVFNNAAVKAGFDVTFRYICGGYVVIVE